MSVGDSRCTNPLQTEHNTALTIHYAWHLWAGQAVQLVMPFDRGPELCLRVDLVDGKKTKRMDTETNWAPREWPLDLRRRGFRLPTESEWEVASRAGSRTSYGYGSEVAMLDRFGWFADNRGKHVHPPRELRPGNRGLA